MAQTQTPFWNPKPRGYSVLEMVVVVAIMVILSASLISGYASMEKTQRLKNAAEKVVNMLYQARSLAISNNAVYHVYIHNWQPANGPVTPKPFKSNDPESITYPRPLEINEQSISIQSYPSISLAMSLQDEASLGIEFPQITSALNYPSHLSISPQRAQQIVDDLDSLLLSAVTPQRESYLAKRKAVTNLRSSAPYNDDDDPAADIVFRNSRVDHARFEKSIYLGVQHRLDTPITLAEVRNPAVLSFMPDGTASANIQFYVTDDEQLADDRDALVAGGVHERTKNARWKLFFEMNSPTLTQITPTTPVRLYRRDAQIYLIQVYRGGIIKILKGEQP